MPVICNVFDQLLRVGFQPFIRNMWEVNRGSTWMRILISIHICLGFYLGFSWYVMVSPTKKKWFNATWTSYPSSSPGMPHRWSGKFTGETMFFKAKTPSNIIMRVFLQVYPSSDVCSIKQKRTQTLHENCDLPAKNMRPFRLSGSPGTAEIPMGFHPHPAASSWVSSNVFPWQKRHPTLLTEMGHPI